MLHDTNKALVPIPRTEALLPPRGALDNDRDVRYPVDHNLLFDKV